MTDDRSRTKRGFVIYDELDTSYGHTVRVQQSSAATTPHCWLLVDDARIPDGRSPHLNVEQAVRIRDARTAFIDDAGAGRA